MKEIKFECEVITPMFLGGADGRTAELRPPSIKGAMRFWWRAVKGYSDINKLRKEEAEIFGSSDEKIGKSKFSIKLKLIEEIKKDNFRNFIIQQNNNYQGLEYLFYSTFMQNRKRQYYDVGTKFIITFLSKELKELKIAIAAFWTNVYFGGIGARSRRGAGNLSITRVEDKDNLMNENGEEVISFIPKDDEKNEDKKGILSKWVKDNFEKVKKIIGTTTTPGSTYSNLTGSKVYIFSPKNNYYDALNYLGEKYKNYRTSIKTEIFKGPNFGFPVMHNSFTVRIVSYQNNKMLSERRSSPLIFKVIKMGNYYFPMIIWLSGELIPDNAELVKEELVKEEKGNKKWVSTDKSSVPDYQPIEDFLKKFNEKDGLEVIL